LKLTARAFWTPKRGNLAEEYEDAYDYRLAERRFAVADGATEAAFSDRWARSLVQRFTAAPPAPFPEAEEPLEAWLKPIQQRWHKGINWDRLPWFAQDKTRAGAFATMLGMEFFEHDANGLTSDAPPSNGSHWLAFAVGDSCLFQVRTDELVSKFPVELAEEFNTSPLLVSSNPASNQRIWPHIKSAEGDAQPGDLFFLATDALAQWFLAQCEAGAKPWQTLCALKDNEEFAAFCNEWRDKRDEQGERMKSTMRNDDVTLLIVEAHTDESRLDEQRTPTAPPPLQLVETEAVAQVAPDEASVTNEAGAITMPNIAAETLADETPVATGDAALSATLDDGEVTVEKVSIRFDPEATLKAGEFEHTAEEIDTEQAEPAASSATQADAAPDANAEAQDAGAQAASRPAESAGAAEQAKEKVDKEHIG